MSIFRAPRVLVAALIICSWNPGTAQDASPAASSSPSVADQVANLLSSPVTVQSAGPAPLPPSLMPNPEALAPSAPITTNSSTMFTWSDVTLSSAGTPLSANTDSFLNAHRFVLQSLLYPTGVAVDTLQAAYSVSAGGVAQVQTLNRFWLASGQAASYVGGLLSVVGSGPAAYVLGMQQRGYNVSLQVQGTNRTVRGLASDLPANVLQAPNPNWSLNLQRLNFTVRLQGANVVPLTAALQKELVSALLHTGAPQGAVGVSVTSFSENGGALQAPLTLPAPLNTTSNSSSSAGSSGRKLLQGSPYADATLQVLCQGCSDPGPLQAALTSPTPAALFNAYGSANGLPAVVKLATACPSCSPRLRQVHLHPFPPSRLAQMARTLRGLQSTSITATSALSATTSKAASGGGGHSGGHVAAIVVPIVVVVAAAAAVAAGCITFNKSKQKKRDAQPVYKSESGVPFNETNLDSARGGGPDDPSTPVTPSPNKVTTPLQEPDHAPPGGVRVGPGRPQRSWLHRLTATPMRTTSGQNWLQVMREKAAQPGQPGAGPQGAAPVPQLRPVAISGQNMEVDRVVARVRGRENEQHDALEPVLAYVNANMQEGNVFKGKYNMQAHGWQGPAYMLCSAQRTAPHTLPLSVKLFARGVDYLQEKALLEGPSPTLQEYLPALLESYSATAGANWATSCPACLLIQRPACTLDHWLSNARAEATTPVWTDKISTLYNLFCAMHTLHHQRMVHCDLQPVHFGWFNEQQQWKLLGLATWTHVGSARNPSMCYTLRYAAPEVVQGDQSGREPPLAATSADVWALGVIAFEVMSGQRLFSKEANQADVVSMLLGYTPLPFEENPALFQNIGIPPNAQNMLRQMLQRNPAARPGLSDVLSNSLFAGLIDPHLLTIERAASNKQIWSSDFRSQMSNAVDSLDSVEIIGVQSKLQTNP